MLKHYIMMRDAIQSMKDETGQDMIEYALLGALIAVVVAAALPALSAAIVAQLAAITAAL